MKSLFNRITFGLVTLSGLAAWLIIGEGRPEISWLGAIPIGAAASFVGCTIGVGIFALFTRSRSPRWQIRLVSALTSAIIAAATCAYVVLYYSLYVDSLPHTTDAPVALLTLIIGLILVGPAAVISAIVLGAGAGTKSD